MAGSGIIRASFHSGHNVQLRGKQINYLRGLAHHLKVVVSVGNDGISKSVVAELDTTLKSHELVKVKLMGDTKAERQVCLERLCAAVDAAPVQLIGKTGVLYRPAEKPVIVLP